MGRNPSIILSLGQDRMETDVTIRELNGKIKFEKQTQKHVLKRQVWVLTPGVTESLRTSQLFKNKRKKKKNPSLHNIFLKIYKVLSHVTFHVSQKPDARELVGLPSGK